MLDPDDIRLLTQIGFIAAARADVQRAEVIFGALLCVRPERSFGHIGIATALLNAGRASDAVMQLEHAQLRPGEDADMVQAFLGLALQLDARASEAMRVLRNVAKLGGSTAENLTLTEGALLAQRLLGETPQGTATTVAATLGQTK